MKAPRQLLALHLAVLALAGAASADPEPSAIQAQVLFEDGREAMRRGDYAEACLKFAESERQDPSNGTLLNLILCEERLGKVATAWVHAQQLLARLPPGDPRKPFAERRLAALAPRVPRVAVRLSAEAPRDTKVLLDDTELDISAVHEPMPIDPGLHHLLVRAPDRADQATELVIEEGRTYEWLAEVSPEQRQASRPPAASPVLTAPRAPSKPVATRGSPSAVPAASRAETSSPPRWLGWTATGVGAASVAAGGVLLVMAFDRKATVEELCPDTWCPDESARNAGNDASEDGKRLRTAAITSFAVGVAGLGFGIYTLAFTGHADRARGSSASVAVTASSALLEYRAAF